MEYTPQFGPHAGLGFTGSRAELYRIGDEKFLWLEHDPVVVAAWARAVVRENPKEAQRLRAGDTRMLEVLFGKALRDSRHTLDMDVLRAFVEQYRAGDDLEGL